MQMSKNGTSRNVAYTVFASTKMFVKPWEVEEERRILRLDFGKRTPVRPPLVKRSASKKGEVQ